VEEVERLLQHPEDLKRLHALREEYSQKQQARGTTRVTRDSSMHVISVNALVVLCNAALRSWAWPVCQYVTVRPFTGDGSVSGSGAEGD
jgi:hypothetical protein